MAAPPLPPPAPAARWKLALGVGLAVGVAASFAPKLASRRAAWAAALTNVAHPLKNPWIASFAPSAAAASFACLTSLAEELPRDVLEPKTGVSFPAVLEERKQLAGIGLRKKSIFGLKNINVYAFGIYADEASLKEKLGSKYSQLAVEDLKKNKNFYEDVVETDSDLTVRLIIVYGRLKIGSVRSAFEESIGNRIRKFSGTENKPLLESFTSLFRDEYKLPQGTSIDISRHPGHVLETKIDGKEIGTVQSPLLCRALFDLYIGEDPFDTKCKEEIGVCLASLLTS